MKMNAYTYNIGGDKKFILIKSVIIKRFQIYQSPKLSNFTINKSTT